MVQFAFLVMVIEAQLWIYRFSINAVDSMWIDSDGDKVACHKLVLKGVSYPKIVKNTPILIEQSIACNVYT